jgi:uncharacterized protein
MPNHHGDFIWYELMTPDPRAAEAFYGPLTGWRFESDESYRHIAASEGHVGGILPLTGGTAAGGTRAAWLGYVMVDDVDRMAASIAADGGTVHRSPWDMAGVGRMAMVADPQGAVFYVIAPAPPAGREDAESHAFSYDRPRQGHCAWNELATSDPENAQRFYARHFGWVKDGEMDMPVPSEAAGGVEGGPLDSYTFLRHAGRAPAGGPMGQGVLGAVMPLVPGGPPVPAWTFYFRVAGIEQAAAGVAAGGGALLQEPVEIPGGEFALVAADPQGAVFGLVGPRAGAAG